MLCEVFAFSASEAAQALQSTPAAVRQVLSGPVVTSATVIEVRWWIRRPDEGWLLSLSRP